MPLSAASAVATAVGLFGSRLLETPGIIIDIDEPGPIGFIPFVFAANAPIQNKTKDIVVNDHIIPGRHAPLQETVAGGAERLDLEILMVGAGEIDPIVNTQRVHWLEALMYPEMITEGLGQNVAKVGHRISLTYGAWIIEREYLIRSISIKTGPGQSPFSLLPYRVSVRLSLQEAFSGNYSMGAQRNEYFAGLGRLGAI